MDFSEILIRIKTACPAQFPPVVPTSFAPLQPGREIHPLPGSFAHRSGGNPATQASARVPTRRGGRPAHPALPGSPRQADPYDPKPGDIPPTPSGYRHQKIAQA